MKYKNIIFDLDGTLWDSTTSIAENWNEVLARHNLLERPLVALDMHPYMGLLIGDVLKTIFPEITEEFIQKIIAEIIDNERKVLHKNGGTLYENVQKTLEELAENHNLYIVSNALDGYIQAFVEYFNFQELFKDFESHGATGKNKAENIQLLMARNHLKPTETVYVGDTQTDYHSAKENDLDFIFCAYGFGELDENLETLRISNFADLLQI
ncbi:MAG: HAD family hydrolase [Flavobacteriaceae bacterium]|nr:HAD family hydrolase [Flavobacteriaceae bacterium]